MVRLEERPHPVVIDLRDRVELVVVALRAVDRQAEERLATCARRSRPASCAVEHEVVTAPGSRSPAACPGRRDTARRPRASRGPSGRTLVGVQRLDDPVAPVPDVLLAVRGPRSPSPHQSLYRQMSIQCRPQRSPCLRAGEQRSSPTGRSHPASRRARTPRVSSAVGGRPTRSRQGAAASQSRVGRACGVSPRCSCPAAMKASIGLLPHPPPGCAGPAAGTDGTPSGRADPLRLARRRGPGPRPRSSPQQARPARR